MPSFLCPISKNSKGGVHSLELVPDRKCCLKKDTMSPCVFERVNIDLI